MPNGNSLVWFRLTNQVDRWSKDIFNMVSTSTGPNFIGFQLVLVSQFGWLIVTLNLSRKSKIFRLVMVETTIELTHCSGVFGPFIISPGVRVQSFVSMVHSSSSFSLSLELLVEDSSLLFFSSDKACNVNWIEEQKPPIPQRHILLVCDVINIRTK